MKLSDVARLQEAIVEIPATAPEYPAPWKILSDSPKTLYALGNVSLLQTRTLTIVGSRRTPVNALKLGGEIAYELSAAFTLATGTADGGDEAAIEGALRGSGNVICLLAGGFSALPQANLGLLEKVATRGLLLAVHPFETPVRNYSYEYRNKLLAALSEGTFVLSAGEKSGALITARYAYKYKKPLFAFPYPPNAAAGCGCNAILKNGGHLVENSGDIAKYYGVELAPKKQVTLTADEEKLYAFLQEKIQAHVGELGEATGLPVYRLRPLLTALEVKGLIVATGGNRYAIV